MDAASATWLAPVIALASAAFFGLMVHLHRKGLDTTDGATGSLINSMALAGMFWLSAPLWMEPGLWRTPGALIFAALGCLFPVGALRLQMLSVPRLGPVLTGAMGAFNPVFAAIPALILFGEYIGPQGWIGLSLMIGGLFAMSVRGRNFRRDWPLWVILIPLTAAAIRGGMQPGMKLALVTAPNAAFGVMVMATVSSALMVGLRIAGGKRLPAPTRGWLWFGLAGMVQGTGLFLLTTALKFGDVVIAAALSSTAPLWALFYGAVVFRREILGARHLMVAALVVAGGALVVTR